LLLLVCLAGPRAPARAQQPLVEPFVISPVDEGLFRALQPRRRAEFEEMRQAGVRAILDVRAFRPFSARHVARLAAEYGIEDHHDRYPALPRAMEEAEGAFQEMLRLRTPACPLLMHCQQNRDRTSLLIGLYRVRVQGWSPEAAFAEMKAFGLRDSL